MSCEIRSGWSSSIRSISFLRSMYFRMSVLDRRIRDFHRKNVKSGQERRCSLLVSKKNISIIPRFDLSGGQKRRAAIAGVLAMRPKVLVLDEPTAGLDPKGRDEILDQIAYLHAKSRHDCHSSFPQYGRYCKICGSYYCDE